MTAEGLPSFRTISGVFLFTLLFISQPPIYLSLKHRIHDRKDFGKLERTCLAERNP
jgi:hypothetical protein